MNVKSLLWVARRFSHLASSQPVVSEGDRRVKILEDGWTAVTLDNSRTAQKEHTVLITDTGVEVYSGNTKSCYGVNVQVLTQ